MFGAEIASAFVRIRPNMSGFKSETETGVRSSFSEIAKVAGIALSAGAAFEFGKGAVEEAANVQKSQEAVRAEFGKTSRSLVDLADTFGVKFGAINGDTLAASASFGTLFRNLGFGPAAAAQMTAGFEKLALSVNAIKGGGTQGAAEALQAVLRGAAGSTRGLKQMGIIVDTASEKLALFGKNAVNHTAALTAAQRTLAIYRIATAQLSGNLQLAKSRLGDFANQQAHLSAEWHKAKEALGGALLPVLSKLTSELARWLGRMERSGRLQRDFNAAAHVARGILHALSEAVSIGEDAWHKFSGAVGGATGAAAAFFAVWAITKIKNLAGAIVSDLVTNGFRRLQIATEAEKVAYIEAFGTMEIATIGLSATIKSALISTGIGALVVAVGLATSYVITHWDQVKRWTVALGAVMAQIWRGTKEIIVGSAKVIGGSIVNYLIFPMKEFIDVAAKATGWIPFLGSGVSDAAKAIDGLFDSMKNLAENGKNQIVRGAQDIGGIGKAWTDSMAKSAGSPTQKDKLHKAGQDAGQQFANGVSQAVGGATTGALAKMSDAVRNAIAAAHQAIEDSVRRAKDNLDKIGQDLAKTIEKIQAKIGGAAGALAGSPQGQAFQKLKKLIESGAPSFEIDRARKAFATQLQGVGTQKSSSVQQQLGNLTAAFNQGKISYQQFTDRLHKVLAENGITLARALKVGGSAFAETYKAQVAALAKQARAIADVPAKFRGIGGAGGAADIKIIEPLNVIKQEQAKVRAAIQKAAAQAHTSAQRQVIHLAAIRAILARHTHRPRREGPVGVSGPLGAPRRGEPPVGPRGSGRSSQGPVGAHGPLGAPIHDAVVRRVGEAVRDSGARIDRSLATHRAAVVAALATMRTQLSRNDQAVLHADLRLLQPLDRIRSDHVRIAARAEQQRERLIRSSDRTNTILRGIAKRTDGHPPGFGKEPKGKGSHDARMGAVVGSRG